jgi:hypothetical protein
MLDIFKAINIITQKLHGYKYAIRGTASLTLQGFELNVDDIDIICNEYAALKCNELFKEYLVEPVKFSESSKFKSYFGKFLINDMQVEIMGDWQIKKANGEWSRAYDGEEHSIVKKEGLQIPTTSISQELGMFAEMGRWTAFHKIKKQALEKGLLEEKQKPQENKPEQTSNQLGLF